MTTRLTPATMTTMPETTYPYGYARPPQRLTMAELETKATVRNAHPEYWRRLRALLIASEGRLGIGTLWRSSDLQLSVFLQRHHVVASGGCCSYNGNRYALLAGNAHAAPPGKSFHEGVVSGKAAALDAIGDLAWMHSNEAAYGFKDFRNVGNEPWHLQCVELPNSVSAWIKSGSPEPSVWALPDGSAPPTPAPTPTPTPAPVPEPTQPTPLQQGDDDMKQIYYEVAGANARFIGIPPIVEWTGTGTDKAQAAIAKQLEIGNMVKEPLTGGPNAFGFTFLRGPLPEGDTLHTWTGDEFAGRI